MRNWLLLSLFCLLFSSFANAQQGTPAGQTSVIGGAPDCQIGPTTVNVTGRSAIFRNGAANGGCTSWVLMAYGNGSVSTVSVELDEAPDSAGAPGSWVVWPGGDVSAASTHPITSATVDQASVFEFFPWVSVNVTTLTGAGSSVTYVAYGYRPRNGPDANAVGATPVQAAVAKYSVATMETAAGVVSSIASNDGSTLPLAVETFGVDPCAASGVKKSHAFATITTATTTALVAVSGSTQIYVCEIDFEISGTTTAGTVLFEQGTGVACAAATASLTATYTDAASSITDLTFHIGNGAATAFTAAASTGLCAVTTVGTAPSIPVDVTYVQQ